MESEDIVNKLSELCSKEEELKKKISILMIELEQIQEDIEITQTAYMHNENKKARWTEILNKKKTRLE